MKTYKSNEKIDFFRVQKKLFTYIGAFDGQSATTNKHLSKSSIKCLQLFYNAVVLVLTIHMAILFTISAYFDILNGTFAEISYSVSQSVIYQFSSFVIFYFQYRSAACYHMVNYINDNFKYRSAKGFTYVTTDTAHTFTTIYSAMYSIACELAVFQYIIGPFFADERALPFRCWYPFDPMVSELNFPIKSQMRK